MAEGALFTISNLLGSTVYDDPQTRLLGLIASIICTISCYYLAKKRGRNPIIWGSLGAFFSILPLIALAFTPKKEEKESAPIKETTGNGVMLSDGAAAINDDAFELPKAPRISSSKSLNWYYVQKGEKDEIKGPFSLNDLRKEIHHHGLDSTTYIWCDESDDWTKIAEFSNASLLLDADFIE